jgi:hypothetical protein
MFIISYDDGIVSPVVRVRVRVRVRDTVRVRVRVTVEVGVRVRVRVRVILSHLGRCVPSYTSPIN